MTDSDKPREPENQPKEQDTHQHQHVRRPRSDSHSRQTNETERVHQGRDPEAGNFPDQIESPRPAERESERDGNPQERSARSGPDATRWTERGAISRRVRRGTRGKTVESRVCRQPRRVGCTEERAPEQHRVTWWRREESRRISQEEKKARAPKVQGLGFRI